MTRAAIGLGSNLGDRLQHLTTAFDELAALGAVVSVSSIYETAPVGGPEQGDYLNAVVVVDTQLSPRQILDELLRIERSHGRLRRERWGPRTLDLDLLVHEGTALDEAGLVVPHPHIGERRFVLEPLAEVWPEARIAPGTTAQDAVRAVVDQEVTRFHREPASAEEDTSVAPWQVFAVTMGLALAFWWLVDLVL